MSRWLTTADENNSYTDIADHTDPIPAFRVFCVFRGLIFTGDGT